MLEMMKSRRSDTFTHCIALLPTVTTPLTLLLYYFPVPWSMVTSLATVCSPFAIAIENVMIEMLLRQGITRPMTVSQRVQGVTFFWASSFKCQIAAVRTKILMTIYTCPWCGGSVELRAVTAYG